MRRRETATLRWCLIIALATVMTLSGNVLLAAGPPKPLGKPVGVASGPPPVNVAKPTDVAGGMPLPPTSVGRRSKPPTPRIATPMNTFGQTQILSEPTNSQEQLFGAPVTVSKDNLVAVISATQSSDFPGAVYVYTRNTATNRWNVPPVALPTAGIADLNAGDQFGFSIAINNDPANRTIIVGTKGGSDSVGAPGAAYAFVLSGGTWTLQHEFNPTGTPTADAFGWSVALSSDGNTALIGAPETNVTVGVTTVTRQGVVYAYTRSGTVWTQQQRFTDTSPPGASPGDHFGASVSLSSDGNTALIGADAKGPVGQAHGDAFVYTRSGNTYGSEQLLEPADLTTNDSFGLSASLSGDGKTALIGAPEHPNSTIGAAYLFTNVGGTWGTPQELNETTNTGHDYYGGSVALSGDGMTAVVGAALFGNPAIIGTTALNQGAAWIYASSGGTFIGEGQQPLLASDAAGGDEFGVAVAVPQTGTSLLVGASMKMVGGNPNQGQVYYYTFPDLSPAAGALPGGTVGTAYSQAFVGANGAGGPYTYALASGALPPGLSLSPNGGSAGLLSGTPTTAGSYSFSVTVTDTAGGANTQAYTLAISAAATTTTTGPATVSFSPVAQNVTLSATVTSTIPVNEGTVTFTIRNTGSTIIATGTSGTVAAGAASAVVSLPANTPAGSYTITAVYNPGPDFLTSSGTNTLAVIPPSVTALTVTPAPATVKVGQNVSFMATATLSDGQTVDVTNQATWGITSPPGVAVINQQGVAMGQSPSVGGPVTVTAAYGGKTGSALLTVTPPIPIVIMP